MISGNAPKGKTITGSPLSPKRFKGEKQKFMGARGMRGLQLTKEQLEELYWKQGLSLDKIEERLDCSRFKVYYWLKAFGIKRRAEYKKHLKIEKEVLEALYWKQKL